MKDDSISRQTATQTAERMYKRCDTGSIEDYHDLLVEALMALPSAKSVDKDINVPDNDTIYRQDAIKAFCERCGNLGEPCDGCNDIPLLYSLPPAQPKRGKGRWIEQSLCDKNYRFIKCSECGDGYVVDMGLLLEDWAKGRNFCIRCGADMRGDDHAD